MTGVQTERVPIVAEPRTTRSHLWILFVIGGAQLMVVLDSTIVIIALPSIQRSLGFSNADRQWVVTAYTLGFGGLLLLGGRIGDLIGPKRTLIIGVVGFAAASAVGGASQTTGMLIGARALQGAFGALLAPSVLSILSTTFTDPRERGRAFGIYVAIAVGGGAFGLILGGLLTQYADWRWCLYVNLPIAAIVTFGAVTLLPKRSGQSGVRLDIPGAILGCGGLVALVYGLGEAAAAGWSSPQVVIPLLAAVALLSVFVLVQTRVASPLLPMRILADRNRAGSFLTIILAVLAMFGTFLSLTYLLQNADGYSPFKTGIAFLPLLAVNGLTATQLASRLMSRMPIRALVIPGLLIAALGVALLTQLTPDASYVTHLLPTELLLGLGLGLALVPCISTATNHAEPARCRHHLGHHQHLPAGRRLHRHRPAQHHRRHRQRRLPGLALPECHRGHRGHRARVCGGQCLGGRVAGTGRGGGRCPDRRPSRPRPPTGAGP